MTFSMVKTERQNVGNQMKAIVNVNSKFLQSYSTPKQRAPPYLQASLPVTCVMQTIPSTQIITKKII